MESHIEKTLACLYGLDVETYSLTLLADLDEAKKQFSLRTWDVLRENRIFFASDLLDTSVEKLKQFAGMTEAALEEINHMAMDLSVDQGAVEMVNSSADEDQALKVCHIHILFDTPFSQRDSYASKVYRNCQIQALELPEPVKMQLLGAGLVCMEDVLMRSPAQLIRHGGLSILEMPVLEGCVAAFFEKEQQHREAEKPQEEPLEKPCQDLAVKPQVQESQDAEGTDAEEEKETFAQIYQLTPEEYEDDSVFDLQLSVRISNIFKKNQIQTIADLLRKSPEDMMQYRNFGRTSMTE